MVGVLAVAVGHLEAAAGAIVSAAVAVGQPVVVEQPVEAVAVEAVEQSAEAVADLRQAEVVAAAAE